MPRPRPYGPWSILGMTVLAVAFVLDPGLTLAAVFGLLGLLGIASWLLGTYNKTRL
jgi:hypothetical protein